MVLMSGGMDSCVAAAIARRTHDLALLHLSYGQRTEARERRAFRAIARHWGVARTLVSTLRADHRPRLVALTADATDQQRRDCIDAGMDGYLAKPITVDGLVTALEQTERRPA